MGGLPHRRHGPRERGRHVRVVAQRQRELLGRRLEVGDVELRVLPQSGARTSRLLETIVSGSCMRMACCLIKCYG